jgi:hypothetical protein
MLTMLRPAGKLVGLLASKRIDCSGGGLAMLFSNPKADWSASAPIARGCGMLKVTGNGRGRLSSLYRVGVMGR